MHGFLKQSTASQGRILGPFVDDTDFKTPETGLTISNTDVKLSKGGAASVNKNSGGGTHRVNGMYSFDFDATDTDTVGELSVSINVSGALIVVGKFTVLEEAIYDAIYGASANGFNASGEVTVGTSNDKTGYSISGSKTTLDALNDVSQAEVNTQVDTALTDIGLDHLVSTSVAGADVADDSIIAQMVSKSGTADWDSFNNTSDSMQAIKDGLSQDLTVLTRSLVIPLPLPAGLDERNGVVSGDITRSGYPNVFGALFTSSTSPSEDDFDPHQLMGATIDGKNASQHSVIVGGYYRGSGNVTTRVFGIALTEYFGCTEGGTTVINTNWSGANLSESGGDEGWTFIILRSDGFTYYLSGDLIDAIYAHPGIMNPFETDYSKLVWDELRTILGLTDTGTPDSSPSDGALNDIQTNIGTPVALDGGSATIGSMLTKMADDNGGADYDATTDSLEASSGGSGTDWTTDEKTEIRTVLGITDTGTPDSTPSDGVLKEIQDNIDAIEVDTQDLQTQVGAAGAGLTDLGGMSTAMKAEVQAEVEDGITAQEPVDANVIQVDGSATPATRLGELYSSGITKGEVSGGSPTVLSFQTNLAADAGTFDRMSLTFLTGANAGQTRFIDTFVQPNGFITISSTEAFTDAPSSGDEFLVIGAS